MASTVRTSLFELSPKAQWSDRFARAAGVLKSFTLSVDQTVTFSAGLSLNSPATQSHTQNACSSSPPSATSAQELGYAVWSIAEDDVITLADVENALPIYESKLDSSSGPDFATVRPRAS